MEVKEEMIARGRGVTNLAQASPRRVLAGNILFFPAATLYAIFVLPASVFSMIGITGGFAGLASPGGHAREMLFGFALAVVAGNQIGAMGRTRLAAIVGLWGVSRVTFLLAPQGTAATVTGIAFAAIVAAHIAPRLFKAAKKLRNQALPLVLTLICVSDIGFQVAHQAGFESAEHTILVVAVLLFTLLMLFMGGRILAPAAAGQFYRQGGNLDARVQPRIESGLIIAMGIAIAASAVGGEPRIAGLAATAMMAAGLLAAARLLRWRLWALRARPDLLCLGAGYGWLVIGLVLFGIAVATGRQQATALHAITVGGLGTLTLNVIAMTWLQKARQDPSRARLPVWGTILIGAATLMRGLAGLDVLDTRLLLLLASACWSSAFALLLVLLVVVRARPRQLEHPGP